MTKSKPSTGNQRADARNPNNQQHKAAQDNKANQKNPNNARFGGGRKGT